MSLAEVIAGIPAAVSKDVADAQTSAASWQDAQIKRRDWQRQRETQFILSKYSNERGELTAEGAQAAMQHASRADLLPEVQKAIEERTVSSLQSQIDAHANRQALESMGVRPSLVSQPTSSMPERIEQPQEQPDLTWFTTPDMAQQQPRSAPLREGEVRVPGAPEAMPAPTEAVYRAPQGTYWSDAMREQPTSAGATAGGQGGADFDTGGSKYVSLKDKAPSAVAAVRLQVEQNLGIAPGAPVEEVEAAYNRLRKAIYAPAVAGQLPVTAFRDPKTNRIDLGAWEKHKADIRTKAAEAEAKLSQAPAEQVKQRRGEMLEEQSAGIALTGAKNTATEKNAEREAVGGMIANVNPMAEKLYGVTMDPAKVTDAKAAQEISDRVGAAAEVYDFIQRPGSMEGSWNKVLADMMTVKGALQTMDKIAGTESGERTVVNMLYPDMGLDGMIRMGWLDKGGLTEKGLSALSTQYTNVGAAEVRRNISNMIKHSATLRGALEKYKAGKDGPKNYSFASPKAADATFSTGAAMGQGVAPAAPAPKEQPAADPGKMKPADGKAEKERRFQEEKKKAKAKKSAGQPKVGDVNGKGETWTGKRWL